MAASITPSSANRRDHGHHRGVNADDHFYHLTLVVVVVFFGEVDGDDTLLLLQEYEAHGQEGSGSCS